MKKMIGILVIFLMVFTGCSTLVLQPADFAWPVESVLKVDHDGMVKDKRYSFSFNSKDLFFSVTKDSTGFMGQELRVIRNTKGYYFMVGNNFKNVYVFNENDGSLQLRNKITISDSTRIQNPAFNQRPPFIELTYDNNKKVNLTEDGIKEDEKK